MPRSWRRRSPGMELYGGRISRRNQHRNSCARQANSESRCGSAKRLDSAPRSRSRVCPIVDPGIVGLDDRPHQVRPQMKARVALLAPALLLACLTVGAPVLAGPWEEFVASVDREEELFRQQWQLLEEKKRQLGAMPSSPRRDEMRRRLGEVEERMRSQPHVLYIPPSANLTPEMEAYYARLLRRLEDCGTRNFPKMEGNSLYGSGAVSITVDWNGKLTGIEVLVSSGNVQVDDHMVRVAKATSPFGSLPQRPTRDMTRPFTEVVVFTNFDFTRSEDPSRLISEGERCKWS
jgi:periplasmic protein TonB